ncbi:hypothetical protein Sphch_3159 [Sphingobium chlorophenolicum L-1]|uniref:Helix-turn-helix domain-containing protein n=1 Tax=Sphingobium chlorophenolicum L-1 TaxID=690566 RepID=F6F2W2_SPHCR|nr:helix-turn-helix domain-containing protein [Sphingobium chlorophenolicum]AEG50774.1 hypothetical protein Sphch_3159 [Sphingobium chlorophenolicum L-1]
MELSHDLLSGVRQIADHIGKSERATYHLIENHRIPVFRLGNKIHARRSELDAAFRSAASNG